MIPRRGAFVGRLLLSAEDHDDVSFRVELDDHVRPFVDAPDVVVLVDADDVGERPGVEAFADLANEAAIGTKFEQLRCGGAVGWSERTIRSREYEDVALGVGCHAGAFAEIHVGRQLEKVWHRLVRDLRHLLLRERRRVQQEQRRHRGEGKSFHGSLQTGGKYSRESSGGSRSTHDSTTDYRLPTTDCCRFHHRPSRGCTLRPLRISRLPHIPVSLALRHVGG